MNIRMLDHAEFDNTGKITYLCAEHPADFLRISSSAGSAQRSGGFPEFAINAQLEIKFSYNGESLPALPVAELIIKNYSRGPMPSVIGCMPSVKKVYLRRISIDNLLTALPGLEELHVGDIHIPQSFAEAFPGRLIELTYGSIDLGNSRIEQLEVFNSKATLVIPPTLKRLEITKSVVVVTGRFIPVLIAEESEVSLTMDRIAFLGLKRTVIQLTKPIAVDTGCLERSAISKHAVICRSVYTDTSIGDFVCHRTGRRLPHTDMLRWSYMGGLAVPISDCDASMIVQLLYSLPVLQ